MRSLLGLKSSQNTGIACSMFLRAQLKVKADTVHLMASHASSVANLGVPCPGCYRASSRHAGDTSCCLCPHQTWAS